VKNSTTATTTTTTTTTIIISWIIKSIELIADQ